MNQAKNRMTDVMAQPVPLFASTWVALYCLLRNSLGKGGDAADPHTEIDKIDAGFTEN